MGLSVMLTAVLGRRTPPVLLSVLLCLSSLQALNSFCFSPGYRFYQQQLRQVYGQESAGYSAHRYDKVNYLYADDDRPYQATFEDPPIFPNSIDEMAKDASFSIRVAMISQLKRLRVDVRSKMLGRSNMLINWILLTAAELIDEEVSKVHLFIDRKYDLDEFRSTWATISAQNSTVARHVQRSVSVAAVRVPTTDVPVAWPSGRRVSSNTITESTSRDLETVKQTETETVIETEDSSVRSSEGMAEAVTSRLSISYINDDFLHDDDRLLIIFNPDNIINVEIAGNNSENEESEDKIFKHQLLEDIMEDREEGTRMMDGKRHRELRDGTLQSNPAATAAARTRARKKAQTKADTRAILREELKSKPAAAPEVGDVSSSAAVSASSPSPKKLKKPYTPKVVKNGDILEEVQALCFHSALRSIPVVMINPSLIATAWNDFGAAAPLLLSDFAQVYFMCDDYFMLSRKDQWFGVVQRAATGFDLFFLEGCEPVTDLHWAESNRIASPSASPFPSASPSAGVPAAAGIYSSYFPRRKATRLKTWEHGVPNNIRSELARFLRSDPAFTAKIEEVTSCNTYESTIQAVTRTGSSAITGTASMSPRLGGVGAVTYPHQGSGSGTGKDIMGVGMGSMVKSRGVSSPVSMDVLGGAAAAAAAAARAGDAGDAGDTGERWSGEGEVSMGRDGADMRSRVMDFFDSSSPSAPDSANPGAIPADEAAELLDAVSLDGTCRGRVQSRFSHESNLEEVLDFIAEETEKRAGFETRKDAGTETGAGAGADTRNTSGSDTKNAGTLDEDGAAAAGAPSSVDDTGRVAYQGGLWRNIVPAPPTTTTTATGRIPTTAAPL